MRLGPSKHGVKMHGSRPDFLSPASATASSQRLPAEPSSHSRRHTVADACEHLDQQSSHTHAEVQPGATSLFAYPWRSRPLEWPSSSRSKAASTRSSFSGRSTSTACFARPLLANRSLGRRVQLDVGAPAVKDPQLDGLAGLGVLGRLGAICAGALRGNRLIGCIARCDTFERRTCARRLTCFSRDPLL